MNFNSVLQKLNSEWEALIKLSNDDEQDVPVLYKHQAPINWIDCLNYWLYYTYGVCTLPLIYVII